MKRIVMGAVALALIILALAYFGEAKAQGPSEPTVKVVQEDLGAQRLPSSMGKDEWIWRAVDRYGGDGLTAKEAKLTWERRKDLVKRIPIINTYRATGEYILSGNGTSKATATCSVSVKVVGQAFNPLAWPGPNTWAPVYSIRMNQRFEFNGTRVWPQTVHHDEPVFYLISMGLWSYKGVVETQHWWVPTPVSEFSGHHTDQRYQFKAVEIGIIGALMDDNMLAWNLKKNGGDWDANGWSAGFCSDSQP